MRPADAPTIPSAPGDLARRAIYTARLVRDPLRLLRELADRHGDTFVLPTIDEAYVVTGDPRFVAAIFGADPELMDPPSGVVEPLLGRETVVLARGARHRRKRKLLSPPFQGARMKAYGDAIAAATADAFRGLRSGETVDVLARTQRLSLDVIVRAIFGMRDREQIRRMQSAVSAVIDGFPAWLLFLTPLQRRIGFGPWDRYLRASRTFVDLLREEIVRAKTATTARDDILALLVASRDEAGDPLPDDELIDELRTLVIAGHETTATTLAWALYQLHRAPSALNRLRQELAPLGPAPSPAELASLPYLEAVCDETLRLHPIVPFVARRLSRAWTLGPHRIGAGTMLCISLMLTHFDPRLYESPTTFRPERFASRRPSASEFYPYGGGSRRCLGAAMAGYELKVALGTILAAQRFERHDDREITAVMNGTTTRPGRPIQLVSLGSPTGG